MDKRGLPHRTIVGADPTDFMSSPREREDTGRLAFLVAAGILLSRLVGLVRLRVFSHYFGLRSDAADAFNAAFRIPNFLQNPFGEGALSASFIPVYARLLARGDEEDAGEVAGAAAKEGEVGSKRLSAYRERFEALWGEKISNSLKALESFERFSDEELNIITDFLDGQDLVDMAHGFRPSKAVGLMVRHPILAMKVAHQLIS